MTSLALAPAVVLAVALSEYIDSGAPLVDASRSAVILVVGALAIELSLIPVVGLRRASVLGASIALVVVAPALAGVAAIIAVAHQWFAMRQRRLGKPPPRSLTSIAPRLAFSFLTVVIVRGAFNGAFGLPTIPPVRVASAAGSGPDVFVVLLDGYPRADTLEREFAVDNRPFLAELEERGFRIAADSRSNYSLTGLTLPSMFHMRRITDIRGLDPAGSAASGYRAIARALSGPLPALELFQSHGYETVGIPSVLSEFKLPLDRDLDNGGLNQYEIRLLGGSLVGRVLPWVAPNFIYDDQRSRALTALADLPRLAADGRTQLVFAHVMLPHSPFVFGPNGEELPAPSCLPATCALWDPPSDLVSRYRDQVLFLNDQVLAMIDAVQAPGDEPVIVLLSDHGSRAFGREERLRNFFAAATPGHEALFPADMTPLNLFARLANAYLGERLPMEPEEFFVSLGDDPLRLEPVTP